MTKPRGNAVFISADNRVLHVADVDRILSHLGVQPTNVTALRSQLPEIYDDEGHRLQVVTPEEGGVELARRVDAGKDLDKQVLVDRITMALARMQVDLHTNVDLNLRSFRVPIIHGDLAFVLAGLAQAFSVPEDDDHPNGALHDASPHPHFP